jgi:MFS family permease
VIRRVAASAALAVVLLDVTAVGVMLPTLRADLGSSPSGGQWIMNAYLLALAIVLPVGLSARVDRRLLAGAGAVALAAGAIVCATADSTSTLVIGRAIEGAGIGALVVPVTGRGAAALPLVALAFGPLVGGELAERNWWHLWFWAAVPAAALLAAAALLPNERDEAEPLDAGIVLPGAALVAATILLVQSEPWGFLTRAVVAGCALIAALTLGLGRRPWAAAGGALAALCFLMPQYFELGHLIHPLRSGARLSVLTIAAVAGGLLAWRLRELVPERALTTAGALAAGAGAIALGLIDEHSGNALFGGGLLLAGAGFGALAGAAYDGHPGELLPAGAVGATLVLAASGALFQHTQADLRASGDSFEHALSRGVADGALTLLPLAAALVWVAWAARPRSSAARPAAES